MNTFTQFKHHMKIVLSLAVAAALILCSCEKEERSPLEQIQAGEPVVTAEVTSVTANTAVLYGYVNPSYLLIGGEFGFIVSTSANPSLENGKKYVSSEIDVNGKYFVELKELSTVNKYYYKAFLNMGETNLVGEIKSFSVENFAFASIDLGLSVKWANANLGAKYPEAYGDYYAWGEIESKTEYTWETYKWGSSKNDLTKYNTISYCGEVDNKATLEASDDVAAVKLGETWRIPTDEEWVELIENCTWSWSTHNGINGYIVTSKKNGVSIFMPVAGFRCGSDDLLNSGNTGYYWASSINEMFPHKANYMYFSIDTVFVSKWSREVGHSVRAIQEY